MIDQLDVKVEICNVIHGCPSIPKELKMFKVAPASATSDAVSVTRRQVEREDKEEEGRKEGRKEPA